MSSSRTHCGKTTRKVPSAESFPDNQMTRRATRQGSCSQDPSLISYTARLVGFGWQGHLVLTGLAHLDPLTLAKPGELGKPGCRECEWSQGGGLPLPLLTLSPAFATLTYDIPAAYLGQTMYRMTVASVINALDQDK
ncbi:hypothetical protein B0T13DRAFT_190602 [Neurospora crassa]|nr:hypothetical protein B0T13DRAFT_190602 [Neurospora crassa]